MMRGAMRKFSDLAVPSLPEFSQVPAGRFIQVVVEIATILNVLEAVRGIFNKKPFDDEEPLNVSANTQAQHNGGGAQQHAATAPDEDAFATPSRPPLPNEGMEQEDEEIRAWALSQGTPGQPQAARPERGAFNGNPRMEPILDDPDTASSASTGPEPPQVNDQGGNQHGQAAADMMKTVEAMFATMMARLEDVRAQSSVTKMEVNTMKSQWNREEVHRKHSTRVTGMAPLSQARPNHKANRAIMFGLPTSAMDSRVGLYGAPDKASSCLDTYFQQAVKRQCWFINVSTGVREPAQQREGRLVIYNMIVARTREYAHIYHDYYVGDVRGILEALTELGVPNAMRRTYEIGQRLAAVNKTSQISYPYYISQLHALWGELEAAGKAVSHDDKLSKALGGMHSDSRYKLVVERVMEFQPLDYNYMNDHMLLRARELDDHLLTAEEQKLWNRPKQSTKRAFEAAKADRKTPKPSSDQKDTGAKRPVCAWFALGDCSRGDKCQNRHVTGESMRKSIERNKERKARPRDKKDKPPSYKPGEKSGEACRNFAKGRCNYTAEDCRHSHEANAAETEDAEEEVEDEDTTEPKEFAGSAELVNDDVDRVWDAWTGKDYEDDIRTLENDDEEAHMADVDIDSDSDIDMSELDHIHFNDSDIETDEEDKMPDMADSDSGDGSEDDAGRQANKAAASDGQFIRDKTYTDPIYTLIGERIRVNLPGTKQHETVGRVVTVLNPTTVTVIFDDIIMPIPTSAIQLHKEVHYAKGYAWKAIGDSGATSSFVPDGALCVRGTVKKLAAPVSIGGISSKVIATHRGIIRLCANVPGRTESVELKVLIAPKMRRPLIGIRKLDDRGYYMEHGGAALRIRHGPHGPNMMIFHRLKNQAKNEKSFPLNGPIMPQESDKRDRSKLYPIPDECFDQTPLGVSDDTRDA